MIKTASEIADIVLRKCAEVGDGGGLLGMVTANNDIKRLQDRRRMDLSAAVLKEKIATSPFGSTSARANTAFGELDKATARPVQAPKPVAAPTPMKAPAPTPVQKPVPTPMPAPATKPIAAQPSKADSAFASMDRQVAMHPGGLNVSMRTVGKPPGR